MYNTNLKIKDLSFFYITINLSLPLFIIIIIITRLLQLLSSFTPHPLHTPCQRKHRQCQSHYCTIQWPNRSRKDSYEKGRMECVRNIGADHSDSLQNVVCKVVLKNRIWSTRNRISVSRLVTATVVKVIIGLPMLRVLGTYRVTINGNVQEFNNRIFLRQFIGIHTTKKSPEFKCF
jgi:hypothetical protein